MRPKQRNHWRKREPLDALTRVYGEFQSQIPLSPATPGLESLVRFNGNKTLPVHRWFSFKEGFSAQLIDWLSYRVPIDLTRVERILDPFCGAGTSLLSAQVSSATSPHIQGIGIEYNPFIHSVAEAKLLWAQYDMRKIKQTITRTLNEPTDGMGSGRLPQLSTIRNPLSFRRSVVRKLMAYREIILSDLGDSLEVKFLMLGWAAVIERASGLRKDGRALRFREEYPPVSVRAELKSQWEQMRNDLAILETSRLAAQMRKMSVLRGDGRILSFPEIEGSTFDLIVYSPPYLNNIDYSEVYKLELWLSGFVDSSKGFRQIRRGTLRSHPSLRVSDAWLLSGLPANSWAKRIVAAIIGAFPNDENLHWRSRLVRAYAEDMLLSLLSQRKVLDSKGTIVCVVGNSLHCRAPNRVPIATDLLIAALAREAGLRVKLLQIARQLPRRDSSNHMLRESILVLRRE